MGNEQSHQKRQEPSQGYDKVLEGQGHLLKVKEAIWEARSHWRNIGRLLGLIESDIRIIARTHGDNNGDCLHEVLLLWMSSGAARMNVLIEALEHQVIGCAEMAQALQSGGGPRAKTTDVGVRVSIMVSGYGSSTGKSWYFDRCLGRTFHDRFNIGVNFDLLKNNSRYNKEIMVLIWDTQGLNMQPISPFFYERMNGFILLFDVTDYNTFDEVFEQVKRVELLAGDNVPVVLVGNKVDLTDKREVSKEQAMRLAQSLGVEYFEISTKCNINCKESFENLLDAVIATKECISKTDLSPHMHEEKISLKTILQISKRLYKISSFKVLLVGGSIKKLLLRQYCGGWYTHGSELQIKIGIRNTLEKPEKLFRLLIQGACYEDFLKPKIHQSVNGFVIMFDPSNRQSFQLASSCLERIKKAIRKDFPVVMVGYQANSQNSRLVSKIEAQDLARSQGAECFEATFGVKGDDLEQPFDSLIDVMSESNSYQLSDSQTDLLSPIVEPPLLNEETIKGEGEDLTEEDTDALQRLLQDTSISIEQLASPDSGALTLEQVEQKLHEKGLHDLATKLREKLDQVIGDQQQYLLQLEHLMNDDDTITVCYVKVFLVGPPFVGKTTTLNRLLKEYENLRSAGDKAKLQSTLLANCTQVLAFVYDKSADWVCSKNTDEETLLVFRYLMGEELEESSLSHEEPHATESLLPIQLVLANTDEVPSEPKAETRAEFEPQQIEFVALDEEVKLKPIRPATPVERKTHQFDRLKKIKSRLQKLIKNGDYSKMINLMGSTLLNINDIGGQPGFLEMLPALSSGPAMYLVFLDLSKKLNQLYKIHFSRDDTDITPFDAIHTVLSTVSQILSSVASVHKISCEPLPFKIQNAPDFNEKFENFSRIRPIAALIGTHLDKLQNPKESLKEVNDNLKSVTEKFDHILATPGDVPGLDFRLSFFPVDNYMGTEESDISPIREFMNTMFSTHFKEASLPIKKKWLLFGIILRREFFIASMDDCQEIALLLEMNPSEIEFCLWYLHQCVGTLMYYPRIPGDTDGWFKNHVICTPQVVFDSIGQLILVSLRALHCKGGFLEAVRKDWIEKGQFSLELIDKYCSNIDKTKIIPAKKLVQLLEYVNLASAITHSAASGQESEKVTYLMPAILECACLDDLKPPTPDTNNPESLCITFKCGFVPTGVFCGLITRLVSHGPRGILGLTWKLVEQGVKRNCVSFLVDDVHKVILLSHERCYEIRVTRSEPEISLHDLCTHTLSVILYELKELFAEFTPQLAFRCPCPKHVADRNIADLCILSHGSRIRFLCGTKSVNLYPEQQVWFGKHVKSGSTTNLEILKFSKQNFSFVWSKMNSTFPVSSNSLRIPSVCEEDYGFYQCEVKMVQKVVLSVYRALFKADNEVQLSSETPDKIYGPTQSFSGTAAQGCLTVEILKRRTGVSDTQLDTEVIEHDLPPLAGCFDNVDTYLYQLGLSAGQQTDIKEHAFYHGTQSAMKEALKLWRKPNPYTATFRALINITLELGEGVVADKLCKYTADKVPTAANTQ